VSAIAGQSGRSVAPSPTCRMIPPGRESTASRNARHAVNHEHRDTKSHARSADMAGARSVACPVFSFRLGRPEQQTADQDRFARRLRHRAHRAASVDTTRVSVLKSVSVAPIRVDGTRRRPPPRSGVTCPVRSVPFKPAPTELIYTAIGSAAYVPDRHFVGVRGGLRYSGRTDARGAMMLVSIIGSPRTR